MDNNIPKGCKPFDLQKAMAGEPVVTRDGRPYKFGAYNPDAEKGHELSGWVSNSVLSHHDSGNFIDNVISNKDIFMAAKTQKVWVNLGRDAGGNLFVIMNHSEESQDANIKSKSNGWTLLKTIEVEL